MGIPEGSLGCPRMSWENGQLRILMIHISHGCKQLIQRRNKKTSTVIHTMKYKHLSNNVYSTQNIKRYMKPGLIMICCTKALYKVPLLLSSTSLETHKSIFQTVQIRNINDHFDWSSGVKFRMAWNINLASIQQCLSEGN